MSTADTLSPDAQSPAGLVRGGLVQLEGTLALSSVSKAGKIMEILRQLLSEGSISMSNLTDQNSDDVFPEEELFELLQNVYLSNSLLPIPTLYELSNHGLEDRRVWINCNPGHVVGEETARSDELEAVSYTHLTLPTKRIV